MAKYRISYYGNKNPNKNLAVVDVEALGSKQALKKAIKKSEKIRNAKSGGITISKYDKKRKIWKFVSAQYV